MILEIACHFHKLHEMMWMFSLPPPPEGVNIVFPSSITRMLYSKDDHSLSFTLSEKKFAENFFYVKSQHTRKLNKCQTHPIISIECKTILFPEKR